MNTIRRGCYRSARHKGMHQSIHDIHTCAIRETGACVLKCKLGDGSHGRRSENVRPGDDENLSVLPKLLCDFHCEHLAVLPHAPQRTCVRIQRQCGLHYDPGASARATSIARPRTCCRQDPWHVFTTASAESIGGRDECERTFFVVVESSNGNRNSDDAGVRCDRTWQDVLVGLTAATTISVTTCACTATDRRLG